MGYRHPHPLGGLFQGATAGLMAGDKARRQLVDPLAEKRHLLNIAQEERAIGKGQWDAQMKFLDFMSGAESEADFAVGDVMMDQGVDVFGSQDWISERQFEEMSSARRADPVYRTIQAEATSAAVQAEYRTQFIGDAEVYMTQVARENGLNSANDVLMNPQLLERTLNALETSLSALSINDEHARELTDPYWERAKTLWNEKAADTGRTKELASTRRQQKDDLARHARTLASKKIIETIAGTFLADIDGKKLNTIVIEGGKMIDAGLSWTAALERLAGMYDWIEYDPMPQEGPPSPGGGLGQTGLSPTYPGFARMGTAAAESTAPLQDIDDVRVDADGWVYFIDRATGKPMRERENVFEELDDPGIRRGLTERVITGRGGM